MPSSVSQNLTTSVTRSGELRLQPGETLVYTWNGAHTGAVALVERGGLGRAGLKFLDGSATVDASASASLFNDTGRDLYVSVLATGIAGAESVAITLANVVKVANPDGSNRFSGAGKPTNAVTGANVAQLGDSYTDTTTGKLYRMLSPGTTASPQWFADQHEETGS